MRTQDDQQKALKDAQQEVIADIEKKFINTVQHLNKEITQGTGPTPVIRPHKHTKKPKKPGKSKTKPRKYRSTQKWQKGQARLGPHEQTAP